MKPSIGVLLYTYNRTDDARINQEIIRNVWGKSELFDEIKIIHTYNGEEAWYPEQYLEDKLIRRENLGHFLGAEDLINTGMTAFQNEFPDVEYIIILAADTWCVKPNYIASIIDNMRKDDFVNILLWYLMT